VAGDLEQILPHPGVADVELGQRWQSPPAVVVWRMRGVTAISPQEPAPDDEPIEVGRVKAIFENMMKGPKAAAGMVEDAVENNSQAAVMGCIQQLAEGGVAPAQRVNLIIIIRVVAVVGGRGEDWGQV
jgi:hypothetical protein